MSTLPSPDERAAVRGRGLTVRYGDRAVLDNVDLAVRAGEVLALVGPNGAGKSTLLAALAGDLAAGEVLVGDDPVAESRPLDLARRRAVLLQQQAVAFGFTVRQVVTMGRSPWHRTEQALEDEDVVVASMTAAEVTHLADRSYPTLSGGEQGRTSFARVLAQQTPILLLDEPTAALDIRHQESLLTLAREASWAGAAVVVVLHDLSLAAAYADRICVLDDGSIRADGPPVQVLTAELISEVYQHPVEIVIHDGSLLVVPVRARGPVASSASSQPPSVVPSSDRSSMSTGPDHSSRKEEDACAPLS